MPHKQEHQAMKKAEKVYFRDIKSVEKGSIRVRFVETVFVHGRQFQAGAVETFDHVDNITLRACRGKWEIL